MVVVLGFVFFYFVYCVWLLDFCSPLFWGCFICYGLVVRCLFLFYGFWWYRWFAFIIVNLYYPWFWWLSYRPTYCLFFLFWVFMIIWIFTCFFILRCFVGDYRRHDVELVWCQRVRFPANIWSLVLDGWILSWVFLVRVEVWLVVLFVF